MKTPTKTTSHSVYNLNYHIVLVTKYRNKVIKDDIEVYAKEEIPKICARYDWELLALECMPDHVHLFVSAPPTTAPVTIAKTIKSILYLQDLSRSEAEAVLGKWTVERRDVLR